MVVLRAKASKNNIKRGNQKTVDDKVLQSSTIKLFKIERLTKNDWWNSRDRLAICGLDDMRLEHSCSRHLRVFWRQLRNCEARSGVDWVKDWGSVTTVPGSYATRLSSSSLLLPVVAWRRVLHVPSCLVCHRQAPGPTGLVESQVHELDGPFHIQWFLCHFRSFQNNYILLLCPDRTCRTMPLVVRANLVQYLGTHEALYSGNTCS